MATNVRGYSIPVLYLPPGLDEKKIAEVVTSVLLRAALSASTPWPKWILLAALELLHGRRPAPLDAAALCFLTMQSTAHTRADDNIFETADAVDQAPLEHLSRNNIIRATAVELDAEVASRDKFVTPILVKSTLDENDPALMNHKICELDPLKRSEVGNQRPTAFKNALPALGCRESSISAEQPHVVRKFIPNEEKAESMVYGHEIEECLECDSRVCKTILTPPTNRKFIEYKEKHIGKGFKMTRYVDSTTTTFPSECPANTGRPSVQSVLTEDISSERRYLGGKGIIGARSSANSNLYELCSTETLATTLQFKGKAINNKESLRKSSSSLSRNRLTSDIHDARKENTYSAKLRPPLPTDNHHSHQLGTDLDIAESTFSTLPAFDERPTNNVLRLTRRILPSEQLSNQECINDIVMLQRTGAPCDPAKEVSIREKQMHTSIATPICNKSPSLGSSSHKACQTDRCNTANIQTQAKVKMITKWIQVKKKKLLDKGTQNSLPFSSIEIQTCDSVLATVHASTQTDLAGIDGGAVIKRSSVADNEAQTILVYTNSVGVQVHTKKKSAATFGWRLTPVSGVPPFPRLTTSSNATPDGGEREGVQLFHGRPLNRAVEKFTPLIPLQALDGLDAFLSDPRFR